MSDQAKGGYRVPEIRMDLPSVQKFIKRLRGGDIVGSFDMGPESMGKHKGLAEGANIPSELMERIEKLGDAFINIVNQNGDILKTREFADLDMARPDGRADPKKVGAYLFAASAIEVGAGGKLGVRFDNELTFSELGRLSSNDGVRKQIADIARNVEKGVLSTRNPMSLALEQAQQQGATNINAALDQQGLPFRCPPAIKPDGTANECGGRP